MVRFDTYNASAHLVRQLEQSGKFEVVHDGGDNLLVELLSGEQISIYLIETVMPPYEIRQTLEDNNKAGIHTLFVLWGEMFLPENGTTFVPDEWLTLLSTLYGDKIYAFGVYGKDIRIFPVYFEKYSFERTVHYGNDVNVAQLGSVIAKVNVLGALQGLWRIADFTDHQTHKQRVHKLPVTSSKRTAWDILGVSQEEKDRDNIKKIYRRLAMQLHPDINPSRNATEEMQILNEAYEAVLRELELSEQAS